MPEIDKAVDHVDRQTVHPHHDKEESPFLKFEDVDDQVKQPKGKKSQTRSKHDKGTRPHAFENREMKVPNERYPDENQTGDQEFFKLLIF